MMTKEIARILAEMPERFTTREAALSRAEYLMIGDAFTSVTVTYDKACTDRWPWIVKKVR